MIVIHGLYAGEGGQSRRWLKGRWGAKGKAEQVQALPWVNAYIQRIRKRAVIKQCEKDVQSNRIKARDMIRKFQEADVIKHQKRPFFLCQICKDESLMMALQLPL